MVFRNLWRRKARSLLTMLGIGIGVAAVIALAAMTESIASGYTAFAGGSGADLLVTKTDAGDLTLSTVDQQVGERIAQLADSLPIRVKRRALVLNKIGQPNLAEVPADGLDVPGMGIVVRVPFDQDLYWRCARGLSLDEKAGEAVRPEIESLTRLCLPERFQQDIPTPR